MRPLPSACLLLLATTTAHADGWIVAETPAALAISDAQQGVFRPGLMPAVGVYADNERIAVGLRLRAGVLRNGPAPGNNLEDPGVGGLATGSLAFRFLLGGGWAEVAGGGGMTGKDFVPALEVGAGWSFVVRGVDVGPSVRYLRVVSRGGGMDTFGTAELLLAGIDVRFGKSRPARVRAERAPPVAVVAPRTIVEPVADRDDDRLIDADASCAELLEGCPGGDDIIVENDRIILDEHVLFDLNHSRVRSRGRAAIARIAKLWALHGDWKRVTIEGHGCALGTDEFNQQLSQERAVNARAVLLKAGIAADRVDAIGYGRTRPRDKTGTDDGHRRNRRVEFVIDRTATSHTTHQTIVESK